jgi:hypothetical protein
MSIYFVDMAVQFLRVLLHINLIRIYVFQHLGSPMSVAAAPSQAGRLMKASLWGAQLLLSVTYVAAALTKLLTPMPQLAAQLPWTGELPEAFVYFTGSVDLMVGLGLILPSLTRIAPRLTPAAAAGSVALQLCATAFHAWRGEFSVLPLNVVMLGLSLFVLWGRAQRAPILTRSAEAPAALR